MVSYAYLAIAIVAEVIATSFLKQSDGFTRLVPTVVMAIGYVVAFFFLSLTLREVPTGIAYAIWSGAGMVLIGLAGWAIYGQRLDFAGLVGIALIIAGVLVLNLLSKTTMH